MNVQPVVLTGKHIRLEPMSESHIPGLAAVGGDPSLWRYNPYGLVATENDMRERNQKSAPQVEGGLYLVPRVIE